MFGIGTGKVRIQYWVNRKSIKWPSRDVIPYKNWCSKNDQNFPSVKNKFLWCKRPSPAKTYLLKVNNNRNIRKRCEICSKLTIKTIRLHESVVHPNYTRYQNADEILSRKVDFFSSKYILQSWPMLQSWSHHMNQDNVHPTLVRRLTYVRLFTNSSL